MGKMNKTKEDKFKDSLKSWGDDIETRPFIRVKEDKVRDAFDYQRKHKIIEEQRKEVAKITGDRLEDIHIWDSSGLLSQTGDIKERIIISKEEE